MSKPSPFHLVLLSVLFFTQPTIAASFDCTKAKAPIEQTICANAELSELDERLAVTYKQALKTFPVQGFILAWQRDWLAAMRRTNCKVDCSKQLLAKYRMRLAQLTIDNNSLIFASSTAFSTTDSNMVAIISPSGTGANMSVWGGFSLYKAVGKDGNPVYLDCRFNGSMGSMASRSAEEDGKVVNFRLSEDSLVWPEESDLCGAAIDYPKRLKRMLLNTAPSVVAPAPAPAPAPPASPSPSPSATDNLAAAAARAATIAQEATAASAEAARQSAVTAKRLESITAGELSFPKNEQATVSVIRLGDIVQTQDGRTFIRSERASVETDKDGGRIKCDETPVWQSREMVLRSHKCMVPIFGKAESVTVDAIRISEHEYAVGRIEFNVYGASRENTAAFETLIKNRYGEPLSTNQKVSSKAEECESVDEFSADRLICETFASALFPGAMQVTRQRFINNGVLAEASVERRVVGNTLKLVVTTLEFVAFKKRTKIEDAKPKPESLTRERAF